MKSEIDQEVLRKWGVYQITNLINGDFYIGSTTESFKKRIFYKHISDYYLWLNDETKRAICPILYKAFKKYGIENFKVEILICFNRKKDSKTNKKIVTYLEGKLVRKLKAHYNICKFPELGGCPNLGRKLDSEWKQKISEKSKLYKHSNNEKVYNDKKQQNKDLSSIYSVEKENIIFQGSAIECCNFLNVKRAMFYRLKNIEKYKIQKIKSQKQSIKLIDDDKKEIVFNSFGECDKFLKMWRGFTSTQVVNKKEKILNHNYELL